MTGIGLRCLKDEVQLRIKLSSHLGLRFVGFELGSIIRSVVMMK